MKRIKTSDLKQPLVSVIIPVYNAEKYLKKSVMSIINQTYKNFEIIIVDDQSTDSSWTIIQQLVKKYPQKIQALQPARNINKEGDACFNLGITIAKGKYLARMDADDIATRDRLKLQVEYLENNTDIFMVGGQAHIIDKDDNITGTKNVPTSRTEILNKFFAFHPIIHPTVMFRNLNPGHPFYLEKYADCNDYYTFFTLLMKGRNIVNLPDVLLHYRIHGMNCTVRRMKRKLWTTLKVRWEMIMKHGYNPTSAQWISFAIQFGAAVVLPETLLRGLYMLKQSKYRKFSIPTISIKLPTPLFPLFAWEGKKR